MTEHKRIHTHKETKGKETDEANILDILGRDDKEDRSTIRRTERTNYRQTQSPMRGRGKGK